MASLETYKGLLVLDTASGAGGAAINNNFRALADNVNDGDGVFDTMATGGATPGVGVDIAAVGSIVTDAGLVSLTLDVGGGYGSTGATIAADGDFTTNGLIFSDATVQGATGLLAGGGGSAGTITAYPPTNAKGTLTITTDDNTGDTVTNLNVALQAGARTYTVVDAGASADFVMTAGNQNIGGVKAFTSGVGFLDGISFPIGSTQSLLAAGQIVPSEGNVAVAGNGGPVTLTSDPQITAGSDGQLLIVSGTDDTNTLTIVNGNGVHVHEPATLTDHDHLTLVYHTADAQWEEVSRNFEASEKTWAFMSRDAASGTNYIGGFYNFGAAADDFNPAKTHGTANSSYAAHLFLVQANGDGLGTDTVVRVTGTSITDGGVRVTSDTQDLTVSNANDAEGTYYETSKKWIGQVSISVVSGPDLLCNYGLCKYWDNHNFNFQVIGFEATWLGAQNDATPNILLRHHKATGWAYNVGAAPTPPASIADMNTDHDTEIQIRANEEGAWKRDNFNVDVAGGNGEGTIIELLTSANRTYAIGNFLMRIRDR